MSKIDILVIGSANIDQVVNVKEYPKLGQTITSNSCDYFCGGKGANQAIAASRLSAKTMFIGCVGNDENGKLLIKNFKDNNVNTKKIEISKKSNTGIALITVYNGNNSIVVVPGSNYDVTCDKIIKNIDVIKNSKIVLLQNEIPIDTIEWIIDFCYNNNIKTILNPAPARIISEEIINKVTFLTPNENEIIDMFENKYEMEDILKKYPNKIIVTLGSDGSKFFDGNEIIHIKSIPVNVVDTTGAGDTFNAAFAYSLINDRSIKESVEFANKVASIKVQKKGAQSGMPYLNEII